MWTSHGDVFHVSLLRRLNQRSKTFDQSLEIRITITFGVYLKVMNGIWYDEMEGRMLLYLLSVAIISISTLYCVVMFVSYSNV